MFMSHAKNSSLPRYHPRLMLGDAPPPDTTPHSVLRAIVRRPRDAAGLMAYDIGWAFAQHGVPLEREARNRNPNLALGWDDGRERFRGRARGADAFVRKWLRLRLNALGRGRVIHESVTPDFLRAIAPTCCPITREALDYSGDPARYDKRSNWSVDRLDNESGYIAGNLVIMSAVANSAKATMDYARAYRVSLQALKKPGLLIEGLDGMQWARLVSMMASQLPTERWRELDGMPMVGVLPSGVYARNALVALQLELTHLPRTLARPQGVKLWAAHFQNKRLHKLAVAMADAYYLSLAGQQHQHPTKRTGWLLEDAWFNAVVIGCWQKLYRELTDEDLGNLTLTHTLDEATSRSWYEAAGILNRGFAGA